MNYALLMKAQLAILNKLFQAAEADNRAFTDEEQTEYDAAKTEFDRLKASKEKADALKAMNNDIPADDPIPATAKNSDAKANKIEAGKDFKTDKPYNSFGDMLCDVIKARKNNDKMAIDTLQNSQGQNTETGADGGFAIPPNFLGNMMEKVESESQLASRITELNLTHGNSVSIPGVDETSRATGSRFGGIQVYWIREGGSGTYKKVKFRNVDIKLGKLAGFVKLTEEMMEDSSLIESWINAAFPAEMAFAIDQAIYSGDGNGIPLGFMNSGALVSPNRATANTVKYEDVIAMYARMPARRLLNSFWLITQEVMTKLPLMNLSVGTGGSAVFIPAGGASVAPYGTLFGRPLIPIEQAVALGTKGDISLVDLTDYIGITKGGLRKDQSISVDFDTDEIALRFIRRINGVPYTRTKLQSKAKSTFYTSPYITLDVPA
jgi:HK97 family phage major capsid protein